MGDPRALPSAQGVPIDRLIHDLLDLLTRSWSYHILMTLQYEGPIRFSALRKKIPGISQRLLTQRLQQLEYHGLVTQIREPPNSRAVLYDVTRRLQELQPVWTILLDLFTNWQKQDNTPLGYKEARSPFQQNISRS